MLENIFKFIRMQSQQEFFMEILYALVTKTFLRHKIPISLLFGIGLVLNNI